MARPDARPADDRTLLETLLHREVAVTGLCLLALVLLAWWWLLHQAVDMAAMQAMPDMPDMPSMVMTPPDPWSAAYLGTAFLMWAIMMIAMMLPSASPMILLHTRFSRRSGGNAADSLIFILSYVGLWALFALLAALGQALFLAGGLISQMTLALSGQRLTALLLIAAGAYQLSPLKQACLAHCRSPAGFLMRYWRPGRFGSVQLGVRHGLYCLGCCALLMLLLFVGGVMNLGWIALLTIAVAAEKFSPAWLRISRFIAFGLLIFGFALFTLSFETFPIALRNFLG